MLRGGFKMKKEKHKMEIEKIISCLMIIIGTIIAFLGSIFFMYIIFKTIPVLGFLFLLILAYQLIGFGLVLASTSNEKKKKK